MKAKENITADKMKNIQTRFGPIMVNLDKVIYFRQGIVGMPQAQNFCLTAHPNPKHQLYNLLQSVDFDDLCFLTISLAKEHYQTEDSLINNADYKEALDELEYIAEDVEVVLISTIHNNITPNQSLISVNLKAPILINVSKMEAVQYVFSSPRYPLRYFL